LKHCFGRCTGISFVDASKIQVCHNRRISSHQVFDNLAARGKTSVDWFFGFKLHLVVNEEGELLNVHLTPSNVDDRKPVNKLRQSLFGKVFADRGYVSQSLGEELLKDFGIEFFAKSKRNLKNPLIRLYDQLLSRKLSIVETIIDQLKKISGFEHSRHRSPVNFCVHQSKKPSLKMEWALPPAA
jgi:transposase